MNLSYSSNIAFLVWLSNWENKISALRGETCYQTKKLLLPFCLASWFAFSAHCLMKSPTESADLSRTPSKGYLATRTNRYWLILAWTKVDFEFAISFWSRSIIFGTHTWFRIPSNAEWAHSINCLFALCKAFKRASLVTILSTALSKSLVRHYARTYIA